MLGSLGVDWPTAGSSNRITICALQRDFRASWCNLHLCCQGGHGACLKHRGMAKLRSGARKACNMHACTWASWQYATRATSLEAPHLCEGPDEAEIHLLESLHARGQEVEAALVPPLHRVPAQLLLPQPARLAAVEAAVAAALAGADHRHGLDEGQEEALLLGVTCLLAYRQAEA